MTKILAWSALDLKIRGHFRDKNIGELTLKVPITTAADDKFYDIFLNFLKN